MSGFATTPNFALKKPITGADDDQWGTHWNQNADTLDATLKAQADSLAAVGSTAAQLTMSQTIVTLTAGADAVVAPARARRYLAIMNIDRSDATLNFDAAALAGSGWVLTAAYVSGAQGGGMTWTVAEGVPVNALHAISTGGTRLVVLEGI